MSKVQKNILHVALFVVIFGALLVVASFFDLDISKMLATEYLESGDFYSTNPVGLVVEYIGSFPIFALGIFACLVFMHELYSHKDNTKYFAGAFVLLVYGLLFYFITETLKYYVRNNGIDESVRSLPLTLAICIGLTLVIGTLLIYFYRRVEIEKNKKMLNFAYAIVVCALGYFVCELIKTPMGRMRFRAMAYIGYNFDHFTPWFEVSSAKAALPEVYEAYSDAFKSFPSGHTFAAGVSYSLICLPYVYDELNNVKGKILCYAIPILYTGFVAFYRIRVGAHFMSDVLVGGSMAYVLAELGKYLFFVRNQKKELTNEEN